MKQGVAGGMCRFALVVALVSVATSARATIQFGQLDDFGATTLGWSQGAASPNPTSAFSTGGPNGAGDGYLLNTASGSFGGGSKQVMFNHDQWTGDYVTAGVTRLSMKLANFGTTNLAIRLTFTGGGGQYSSTNAFPLPAGSGWTSTTFLLSSSTMTSIGAPVPLSQVLSGVTELRMLSAANGPAFNGDAIASQLGVDAIRASRLPGDANFNGTVEFDDLVKLAQNYGKTTGGTWATGDFTFDEKVNFDDLVTLAQNYNGSGSITDGVGGDFFEHDWALATSLVPEPALAMVAAGGLAIARRRRRRPAGTGRD